MEKLAICSNLDEYLTFVSGYCDFTPLPIDLPLLSDEVLKCFSDAYKKISGHRPFYNYLQFKKLVKKLTAVLSLPFSIKLFFRRLPSGAYYVHNKNKYFNKQGVYISARVLRNFNNVLRLLLHELCHYYVCISPYSQDVFRLTNKLKRKLSPAQVNETSDLFALYPTEYFAMCLERSVAEKLSDCPRFLECVQAERERLSRSVKQFQQTQLNQQSK